jgi:leucyl-tRNA synthetase
MEQLEIHSAARNVMRLFDRVKDFEKRVVARDGQLGTANGEALLGALTLLAQLLGPLAPHVAEELWVTLGRDEQSPQMPWPGVSFQVPA